MIYVKAYLRGNLGDDLFVRTLVRQFPEEKFYICGYPQYINVFKNEKNVRIPTKFSVLLFRVMNRLFPNKWGLRNPIMERLAKLTVVIGGSIFIEQANSKRIRESYSKKTIIIGANYGPATTDDFFQSVRKHIENAKYTCFRDSASYSLFSDLKNVGWAPDILFAYSSFFSIGERVGFSVIDLKENRTLSEKCVLYESMIANTCNRLIEEGIPISFFNFCPEEGDGNAIHRILAMIVDKSLVKIETYEGDIDAFLQEFNACKWIFATRFHSMVLGWTMGKKVLPVAYSVKHLNVLADITYKGAYINLFDDFQNAENDFYPALVGSGNLACLSQMQELSQKHFQIIEKYVK